MQWLKSINVWRAHSKEKNNKWSENVNVPNNTEENKNTEETRPDDILITWTRKDRVHLFKKELNVQSLS